MARATTAIRVGVGGWNFEPWRDNFFPKDLPHKKELAYASRQLTAIEVNGTYYRTMKPASFKKWHDETPDDFVFSLKASRYATNRRVLGEAGESITRFVNSGLGELGKKLGPIVWQFAPTKQFEPADFEAFLALLPKDTDGHKLRHVLDVRHDSFKSPDYLKLARKYKCATVFADSETLPSFTDLTSDFVYARLMKSEEKVKAGYRAKALDQWAEAVQIWAKGSEPEGLPRIGAQGKTVKSRDVFVYFINGAKERAPAGAQALLSRLGFKPNEAK